MMELRKVDKRAKNLGTSSAAMKGITMVVPRASLRADLKDHVLERQKVVTRADSMEYQLVGSSERLSASSTVAKRVVLMGKLKAAPRAPKLVGAMAYLKEKWKAVQ